MSEFDFIHELKPLADPDHALNLEDDAARLPEADIICTDTLVEGVHFLGSEPPESLAHKLLAVNVSDLAAMNARGSHALLNLSLPSRCDAQWRAGFLDGLKTACAGFGLSLLGGDTTGSLGGIALSATLLGRLEGRSAWRRADAEVGDLVCVSGPIGAGALGLADMLAGTDSAFAQHFRQPRPRTDLIGTAGVGGCADVSDGLLADLAHICQASGVTAELDLTQVPYADAESDWVAQVTGGDDYQLVFSLRPGATLPPGCTALGRIHPHGEDGPLRLTGPEALIQAALAKTGYSHF